MPLDTIPEGFTGEVPYRFAIRIDGNIIYGGYFSEVRATVNGVGASFQNPVTSSISYSGSFSGSAEPGTTLQATLSASLWIYVSNRMTNEAQIIVDPYIYIEPTWEYAGFFGVFQSPGPNDNGVWQRVNRDWMCEFDLDSDGDIDGSDLSDYIETGSFGDLATFATKYGRTNCP
jgi:hypothetical protein